MKKIPIAAFLFIITVSAADVAFCQQAAAQETPAALRKMADEGRTQEARAAASAFLNANPQDPLVPDVLLMLGRLYMRENMYADAEMAFKRLFTEFPTHPLVLQAFLGAADSLRFQRRFADAAQLYEKEIDLYPDDPLTLMPRFDLAYLYENIGRIDDAVQVLMDVIRKGGKDISIQGKRELVQLYSRQKRYYEAETSAKKFLDENPGDLFFTNALAKIYYDQEKYADAIPLYLKLNALEPGNQDFEKMLFSSYKSAGRLDELVLELESEKSRNPGSLEPAKKLKRLYLWDNRSIEALRELEIIVAAEPDNISDAVLLARLYYQNQMFTKSKQVLDNILQKYPGNDAAWKELGNMYFSDGQNDKAKESWEKAAGFNPDQADSYSRLAYIYMEKRLFPEAIRLYEDGRRRIGNDSLFASELAQLYRQQMNYKGAIAEYVRMLAGYPNDAYARSSIREILGKEYAGEDGRRILEEAADRYPDNQTIGLLSAEASILLQDRDGAVNRIEKLRNGNSGATDLYLQFAGMLLERSALEQAAAMFELSAEREPGDTAYKLLQAGRAWYSAGQTARAEAVFEKIAGAMSGATGADEAVFRLANIAMDRGDVRRARGLFARLVSEYPSSQYMGEALFGEARTAFLTGDFDHARTAFEALADNSMTRRFSDGILFYRAEISRLDLKTDDSRKLYSRLAEQYPESLYINDALERLLFLADAASADPIQAQAFMSSEKKLLQGDRDAAEKMLRGLEVSLPDGPMRNHVRLKLAEMLQTQGRLEEAAVFLEAIVDGPEGSELIPVAGVRLGEILCRLGRNEEALRRYQTVITLDQRGYWGRRAQADVRKYLSGQEKI